MNDEKWIEFLNSEDLNCYHNLTQLSQHFKRLLDIHERLILSLFPESEPAKGIAFETGEGVKFAKEMRSIAKGKETWYLMMHCNRQANSPELFDSLYANLNIKAVDMEASMLRLLPCEKGEKSILSVEVPHDFFQHEKEYNIVSLEPFNMASSLFKEIRHRVEE